MVEEKAEAVEQAMRQDRLGKDVSKDQDSVDPVEVSIRVVRSRGSDSSGLVDADVAEVQVRPSARARLRAAGKINSNVRLEPRVRRFRDTAILAVVGVTRHVSVEQES